MSGCLIISYSENAMEFAVVSWPATKTVINSSMMSSIDNVLSFTKILSKSSGTGLFASMSLMRLLIHSKANLRRNLAASICSFCSAFWKSLNWNMDSKVGLNGLFKLACTPLKEEVIATGKWDSGCSIAPILMLNETWLIISRVTLANSFNMLVSSRFSTTSFILNINLSHTWLKSFMKFFKHFLWKAGFMSRRLLLHDSSSVLLRSP